MHTHSPLLYGNTRSLLHGLPLPVVDLAGNHSITASVIGNGSYAGPYGVKTAPSNSTVSDDSGGWRLSNTSTSTTAASILGAAGGGITITMGATDEDFMQIQRLGHRYLYDTTYSAGFLARIALATVAVTDLFIGFAAADTKIIAASAEDISDGIYFKKADVATDLTAGVQKATTETTAVAGLTIVDAGFFVCGITIDAGVVRWYAVLDANNLVKSSPSLLGAGTTIANTNAPNTVACYPSFGVGTEGTGATAATLDWAVWWNFHA